MKWSPIKAAIVAFLAVLALGIVAAIALVSQIHDHAYERGQKFGQGLATFSVVVAVVAYLVQKRRVG
jgi:uncharacterized membrane protein